MATATMGLRRRVQVSPSVGPSTGKRTRSENNNSPSHGNLNSLEPAAKKSRGPSSSLRTRNSTRDHEMSKKSSSTNATPAHWSDRSYASIAGLALGGQGPLCAEPVGLPSPMSYMATYVGNATNLGKSPAVSYLDISNMTGRPQAWDNYAASSIAYGKVQAPESSPPAQVSLPKNFPNDSMFNAYQPWVIKTYGDLAKTKTITIKKYARILRTLRGEEVNSAENSKFRFWVKSKGFHIGQPEGYDPKPADRIIGRHAVTNPGLDPPLYVPTQPPHNKALNGAEGTISSGRVYKKVAIVENFFDIIHAVHVDLEGRPGKHAGQKRTYRTITETYAFLPREAVTRFLLGCTECQRRPRTPSPTTLTTTSSPTPPSPPPPPPPPPAPPLSTSVAVSAASAASAPASAPAPASASASALPRPSSPASPKPGTALSSVTPTSTDKPREASNPPESPPTEQPTEIPTETEKIKNEKYNPLSITNLLRKDPVTRRPPLPIMSNTVTQHIPEAPTEPTRRTPSPIVVVDSNLVESKCVPIDYSIPVTRPQNDSHSFKPHEAQAQAHGHAHAHDTSGSSSESESETEEERGFSPAAGLIDTNLNLLATIQQLHCQVMLALTERLRPPVPASPAPALNDS